MLAGEENLGVRGKCQLASNALFCGPREPGARDLARTLRIPQLSPQEEAMKALSCTAMLVLLLMAAIGCGGGSTATPIITPPPPTGFTLADLSGEYVATFAGSEGTGETYLVLRFTADGKGTITAGTLDYNREEIYEGMQSTALTGTYTVATDGRTALTIRTSSPSLNASTGPFVFSTTLRSDGNMVLMPFQFPLRGSGSVWKVDGTFPGTLSGTYTFLFSGGVSVMGFLDGAGRMSFDSAGNVTGVWDLNLAGGPSANVPFTGTYTVGADGRGTATLVSTGPSPWYAAPTQLSLQAVSSNTLVLLSQDKALAVAGTAEKQSGTVSTSTFVGAYVLSSTGTAYYPGSGYYLGGTAATGRIVSNGNGSVTSGTLDQNKAYSVTSDPSVSGFYNIDAAGRGTATLNTAKGPVNVAFYPVSPKRAFFVTLDSRSMAHGTLDLQSGTGYSSAALKGDYAMVVSAVDFLDDDTCAAGHLSADGAGGLKGTLDVMTAGATYSGLAVTGTYAVTADGRGTATISNANKGGAMKIVFYLLSTREARVLGADGAPLLSGNVSQQ